MSATNLQLNWSSVLFVTTNGTISIQRVTSVTFGQGGELIDFSGDNARYAQVVANSMNRPRCSITSGDVATLMNITPGTGGTITATQLDALGTAGGAINWQMSNAVHENSDDTGAHGQFASGTCTFRAYAPDGITPPLSIASRT